MGKFRQFLTELSARDLSVFSFLDDNFSKYQSIFTRLGICITMVLWRSALRLLMDKTSIFDRVNFLISAQKHKLWAVLTSTHKLCFEQKYEKYQNFSSEIFLFFGGKLFSIFE